jgi:microcystin-dependent protein
MRAQENQQFSNISASTNPFSLLGGTYGIDVVATFGGGSVKLQKLAADGSTYLSVSSATDFTAAGYQTVQLPFGTYRLTIATATAAYASINRVPGE